MSGQSYPDCPGNPEFYLQFTATAVRHETLANDGSIFEIYLIFYSDSIREFLRTNFLPKLPEKLLFSHNGMDQSYKRKKYTMSKTKLQGLNKSTPSLMDLILFIDIVTDT